MIKKGKNCGCRYCGEEEKSMRVLIINAILYTAETKVIPKVKTIKDTMIYDLCLAFHQEGHDVTLYAAEPYKPIAEEDYPFSIEWGRCVLPQVFYPNKLPWMPEIKKFLKKNEYDLIISSEVFSINTYYAYRYNRHKTIAWHEIAKHQAMMRKIPSKCWYNVMAKHVMKGLHVVARSVEAKVFIKQYCTNVEECVIDHGVNLDKFLPEPQKEKYFVVCSQLIKRKRIESIINYFAEFLAKGNIDYKLYIIGEGEEEEKLKKHAEELKLAKDIIFTGKLSHRELMPYLAKAKALFVNTEKDNNMISIIEAIAVGTPILTTEIPLNASYIKAQGLGIAKNDWNHEDIIEMDKNNITYVNNCMNYRYTLSTKKRVHQFVNIYDNYCDFECNYMTE